MLNRHIKKLFFSLIIGGSIVAYYSTVFIHSEQASSKNSEELSSEKASVVDEKTGDKKEGYLTKDGNYLIIDNVKYVKIENDYYKYNKKNVYKLKDGRTVFFKDNRKKTDPANAKKKSFDNFSFGLSPKNIKNTMDTIKHAKSNMKKREQVLDDLEKEQDFK